MLLRRLKDLFSGRRALERRAKKAERIHHAAQVAYLAGDAALALDHCQRLRRTAPEFQEVDLLESKIRFAGDYYFEVLARLIETVRPRTYVEIGVFAGDSLRLVKPPTVAIGIDPQPQLTAPLAANQKLFVETSDGFFAGHDLRADLGGLPVDLAFIDGMHHFEFALRDFANLERYCTPASTVMIHDCFPLNRETAERERRRYFWSGDNWRLVLLLKKYRPDLTIHTIGTAPTGLTLVRNLDPASRLLLERHGQICQEYLALDYSHIEDDMAGKLNLFPNDWERIRPLLG